MNAYYGWTGFDKITIVYSTDDYVEYNGIKYPKAFIIDTNNKKTLQTALNWAISRKNKSPEMVNTNNGNFSLQLISAAEPSSRGGKLSFWMCLIQRDDIKPFAVGINTELLCDFMLESNMHNGLFEEKVLFAHSFGQLGVLHKNMSSYKQLMNDISVKKKLSTGKTSKWKIGYSYKTINNIDVMLGYFSNILNVTFTGPKDNFYVKNENCIYELDFNKPNKVIYSSGFSDNTDFTKNKSIADLIKRKLVTNTIKYKCSSRTEDEKKFEYTDHYYDDIINELCKGNFTDVEETIYIALSIFKQNPDATIKILQDAKDLYIKHVDDIRKGNIDWITEYYYIKHPWTLEEYRKPRYIKRGNMFEDPQAIWKEDKLIDTDTLIINELYRGFKKPNIIRYNGTETIHNDWCSFIDKLIEILNIEKENIK